MHCEETAGEEGDYDVSGEDAAEGKGATALWFRLFLMMRGWVF